MKHGISVIITDLDNTLFDWVDIWYRSFKSMLDKLVLESGVSADVLIPEFKSIHEKYGTAEYAFSIEELPSLGAKYPGEDLAQKFDEAIGAFRCARKLALCLYPTVAETLETLKDRGSILIGYTESLSFYTAYRVRTLGLDRILDYLYSPPDHELPNGLTPDQVRRYPPADYEFRRTVHRHIRRGELKPDPKVLLDIIKSVGATPSEAIYVGDSLMKDVVMAQAAGVIDVWAKYGIAHDRTEYELLRQVTHWTAKDVEREKRLTPEHVKPEFVLESNFGELLRLFEFGPFLNRTHEHIALVIDVWKKTVDVQQHFNDLELRIRNYALTIIAAIVGFAAYAFRENSEISVRGHSFSVAACLFFTSIFLWSAFYFMDRFWYHKLLYGAVDHGRGIENRWNKVLPEIALTDSIGKFSPLKLGKFTVHTPLKIDIFYSVGAALLLVLSLLAQSAVRPLASTNTRLSQSGPAPKSEVSVPASQPSQKPKMVSPAPTNTPAVPAVNKGKTDTGDRKSDKSSPNAQE